MVRRSKQYAARQDADRVEAQTHDRTWLVRLPGLLLVVGGLWLLSSLLLNSTFRVRQVVVEGNTILDDAQVQEVLGIDKQSIFRVSTRQCREALQAAYPCIEDISIRLRLPDRVLVRIEEYGSLLVWESGAKHWLVDEEGQVLGSVTQWGDLAVVHDVSGLAPEPGDRIIGVPWSYVMAVSEALPQADALWYDAFDGIIVRLGDDDTKIRLGHEGDAATKIFVARFILQALATRGTNINYVDLRNPRCYTVESH